MKEASHQRTNSTQDHLYQRPGEVTFLETETTMVVARAWGRRNRTFLFNVFRVFVQNGAKIMEVDSGIIIKHMNVLNVTELYT